MNLKPYPRYKDSGIEWLERMPESWIIKPVWMLFKLGRGRVISREEIYENPGEYPVYSSQTESNGILGYIGTYGFDGKYITWTTDGANAGTLFYREGKFNCTNVCGTLYPQNAEINLKYFTHLINIIAPRFVRYDINPKLMNNVIAGIKVLVPSFIEQNKIANFLDHKTTKIDELIKKNEKLIELLKEKRQAIISHAVTKGLDPNAKMKDSGIEWIGEIPEGWEIKRLKWIARLEYGSSLSEEAREDGSIPVFGSNGIVGEHSKSITGKPAIIIGRKGSYGKVSYSEVPCFPIDTTYYIDSSLTKENIRWLYYLLSSINLDEVTFDTGVPGLSREFAYSKIIPLPTFPEQTTIANYLDHQTARIDEAIHKIQSQIAALKEYRQALISNVVTGKVMVDKYD